jgi:hypothetical protein
MPRDGIIDANLHINAAFYPRRIPVAAATHTISHNKIIHTLRESTFLFVTSRCFSSVQVFCVKGIFYGLLVAGVKNSSKPVAGAKRDAGC